MKLIDIQNILEEWCPLQNAEDFDNVGLLVGDPNCEISKALITIDTTENIIKKNKKFNKFLTLNTFNIIPLHYSKSSMREMRGKN